MTRHHVLRRAAGHALLLLMSARAHGQAAPAPAGAPATASSQAPTEPEFKPGVPGLKMVDVRDHKHLWRELEELQSWEHGDRLSVAEYRSKAIEKTVQFLGLRSDAGTQFASAAAEAVAAIREAFQQRQSGEPGAMEAKFSQDLAGIVQRVTSLLGQEPRHRLFEPECKKWLLRLAFGPSEAKEAKEKTLAQAKK